MAAAIRKQTRETNHRVHSTMSLISVTVFAGSLSVTKLFPYVGSPEACKASTLKMTIAPFR